MKPGTPRSPCSAVRPSLGSVAALARTTHTAPHRYVRKLRTTVDSAEAAEYSILAIEPGTLPVTNVELLSRISKAADLHPTPSTLVGGLSGARDSCRPVPVLTMCVGDLTAAPGVPRRPGGPRSAPAQSVNTGARFTWIVCREPPVMAYVASPSTGTSTQ